MIQQGTEQATPQVTQPTTPQAAPQPAAPAPQQAAPQESQPATLHDFTLDLLTDPAAREAFQLDPEGVLHSCGLSDITPADVQEILPLVLDAASVAHVDAVGQVLGTAGDLGVVDQLTAIAGNAAGVTSIADAVALPSVVDDFSGLGDVSNTLDSTVLGTGALSSVTGLVHGTDVLSTATGLVQGTGAVDTVTGLVSGTGAVSTVNGLVSGTGAVDTATGLVHGTDAVNTVTGLVHGTDAVDTVTGLVNGTDVVNTVTGVADVHNVSDVLVKDLDVDTLVKDVADTDTLVKDVVDTDVLVKDTVDVTHNAVHNVGQVGDVHSDLGQVVGDVKIGDIDVLDHVGNGNVLDVLHH
ncbi:IniB N-terminal domain-containing protein [Lentzea rhizosphaerae]|uniref:IniB N-terminal domain-containing protein n=1 Tax=Lentzea rhizosphaerae TaxID=2041025 RepID=A0ABV8C217_9PSEU